MDLPQKQNIQLTYKLTDLLLYHLVVDKLSCLACKLRAPFRPGHHRFVPMMPTPTLFIVFSFLLRTVEGVGTAMYSTVSYTLLTQFYPEKKGTVVVSG